MPERKRVLAALTPAIVAAALIAALPATSGATPSGTQSVTVNATFSCAAEAEIESFQITVRLPDPLTATVTGTLPQTVNPGDALTLTNASVTFTTAPALIPSTLTLALGSASATGSLSSFPLDASGSSTATVNLPAGALPISLSSLPSGQPLTIPVPATGTFNLPLGTVTGTPGTSVVVSLDTTPGFSTTAANVTTLTGQGTVATLTGTSSSLGSLASPVTIACTASAATLGTVAIVAPASTATTMTTSTTQTTTTTPGTPPTSPPGHSKPSPPKLTITHRLHKSQLTLTVRVPATLRGPVTIKYGAYRGRKLVAFAGERVKPRRGIAQMTFTLGKSALAASRLTVAASTPGAPSVTVTLPGPAG